MNVVAWIVGLIAVVGFAAAGLMKIVGVDPDGTRFRLGYRRSEWRAIGGAEIVGATGMVVGLVSRQLEWIGLASAVALMALMVGALLAHARVEDETPKIVPAVVMVFVLALFAIFIAIR